MHTRTRRPSARHSCKNRCSTHADDCPEAPRSWQQAQWQGQHAPRLLHASCCHGANMSCERARAVEGPTHPCAPGLCTKTTHRLSQRGRNSAAGPHPAISCPSATPMDPLPSCPGRPSPLLQPSTALTTHCVRACQPVHLRSTTHSIRAHHPVHLCSVVAPPTRHAPRPAHGRHAPLQPALHQVLLLCAHLDALHGRHVLLLVALDQHLLLCNLLPQALQLFACQLDLAAPA